MNAIHPHHLGSEYSPFPELSLWWLENSDLFLRHLLQGKNGKIPVFGTKSGNLLIYPKFYDLMEEKMNGRKPKGNGSKLGVQHEQPAPFRWINIPLTAEDVDTLEQDETSLEQLAFDYLQLGMRGLCLSVKYDFARKSFSVSIYRPSTSNDVQPCGISGSATDLRDALLVSLYRFHIGLEGSFDNAPSPDNDIQPRRFR